MTHAHDEPPPSTAASTFDAEEILSLSRTLTLVVSGDSTILDARGGYGGFFGWDTASIIGTSVLDYVPADQVDELVTFFLENDGIAAEAIALAAPFRMSMLDPSGEVHVVDVIPTGLRPSGDDFVYVAVVVPVALLGSITRSLDLEMEGADRDTVKQMLCEELALDNEAYSHRWFLVEFIGEDGVEVMTSRTADHDVARAVRDDLLQGWKPWHGLAEGAVENIVPSTLGSATLDAMTERGWQRAIIAPVHLDDRLVAVYLQLGRVPDTYLAATMKSNVATRISRLVDTTALLMRRWNDDEQLRIAATYDPLTGLHNARSLRAQLDSPPASGAVLFVDVDRFKPVNDTYGHVVGDEVLSRIADRIVDACRDGDFVARVGGDEFVVLLDGVDAAEASAIGEEIIRTVARPLDMENGPDHITVSVGQASLATDDAFDAADQAMLVAKRAGRSRLTIADD